MRHPHHRVAWLGGGCGVCEVTAALIELDQSQREALEKITDWLDRRLVDPKVQQILRVGGHAGSGKTTVITGVDRYCRDGGVSYKLATFAGKAADVLRRKGLDTAQTIHSLIYIPNHTVMAELRNLADQLEDPSLSAVQRRELEAHRKVLSNLRFTVRTDLDDADLLIIDEASMVDSRITEHLKSFGRPILAVGDPAQLPPIEMGAVGLPLFSSQTPDVKLSGQHRFGDRAVLGDVATAARLNQPIPAEAVVPAHKVNLAGFDVILTATNKHRWELVRAVRRQLGKPLDRPVVGDRITFWANNYTFGVFNGGSAVVTAIREHGGRPRKYPVWAIEAVDDLGQEMSLVVEKRGFSGDKELEAAKRNKNESRVVATHSEAMTVWKAQGSEWPRVLVAADYTNPSVDGETKVRWRYTAATRASEQIVFGDEVFHEPVELAKGVTLDLG
jgi:exodeoxyribonuclease-5